MDSIRFILDGKLIGVADVDPTRTLLQYLREDLLRSGTKEGCAEGDCGACTVVVAELVAEKLRFRAVNACIQFLPTLDGKALFTVESLKSSAGDLHPVQQSMVDYHGSQCGFCTPGFIMSMFALYRNDSNPDRLTIDDALSGNLCRCTGYRSIIEACRHMHEYAIPPDNDAEIIDQLRTLQRQQGLEIQYADSRYFAPVSVDELADYYQRHGDAHILAGGTDVGLWVTKQLRELPDLVYIGNIESLGQISNNARGLEIGAAVSLEDAFKAIVEPFPEFAEMFRRFASLPIRNAGTLVGNVANGSPIGDSMPALIAIDTRVSLRRGDQTREILLEALYLDYMKNAMRDGEFIESIIIPERKQDLLLRCYKLCKRFDQDISAICAAFALRLDNDGLVADIRIVFGGMAAIPRRAVQTEKALLGKPWDEAALQLAGEALQQDYSPLSDMRASAAYRSRTAANLLRRFYLETRPQSPLAAGSVNVFAESC